MTTTMKRLTKDGELADYGNGISVQAVIIRSELTGNQEVWQFRVRKNAFCVRVFTNQEEADDYAKKLVRRVQGGR